MLQRVVLHTPSMSMAGQSVWGVGRLIGLLGVKHFGTCHGLLTHLERASGNPGHSSGVLSRQFSGTTTSAWPRPKPTLNTGQKNHVLKDVQCCSHWAVSSVILYFNFFLFYFATTITGTTEERQLTLARWRSSKWDEHNTESARYVDESADVDIKMNTK